MKICHTCNEKKVQKFVELTDVAYIFETTGIRFNQDSLPVTISRWQCPKCGRHSGVTLNCKSHDLPDG